MARVQQVETAVGESDFETRLPPPRHLFDQAVEVDDLGLGGEQFGSVQGMKDFCRTRHGGPQLADHDGGGDVGELGGGRRVEARPQGCCKSGHHGIAGSGDVINLTRLGRQMGHRLGRHQRHALLAAGRQHRRDTAFGDDPSGRRGDLAVVAGRQAAGLLQLAAVRRDPGSAAIAGKVVTLGIDHDRAAAPRRGLHHGANYRLVQQPLAVIGENHCGNLVDHRQRGGRDPLLRRRVETARRIAVNPQQLLSAGNKAILDGGAGAGHADQLHPALNRIQAETRQVLDIRSGGILADHADSLRPRSERRQIAQDVAGAPEHGGFLTYTQHRDRGFRRNTLNSAVDEAVKHDVAQHKHGYPGKALDGAGKVGARRRGADPAVSQRIRTHARLPALPGPPKHALRLHNNRLITSIGSSNAGPPSALLDCVEAGKQTTDRAVCRGPLTARNGRIAD